MGYTTRLCDECGDHFDRWTTATGVIVTRLCPECWHDLRDEAEVNDRWETYDDYMERIG